MVLTNGVGMIDASALSPDHSVATDPQEAERIEVLRGPSALAYGGSAIGGVVNITDNRISNVTVDGLHGRVLGSVSSVDDGNSGSAELRYGAGNWVVTLDGLKRKSSDYTIPMEAISARLAAEEGLPAPQAVESKVVNTAVELTSYGAGLSYVGANGFVGMSVKKLETLYGVPSDEPDPISIDLSQTRIDFRAGLNGDFGPFDRIKLTAGHADYEHVELEDGTPGTRFLSDGWEGRAEFVQPDRDGWQGAVGVQALMRNFDAIGAEVFVPKTRITEQGDLRPPAARQGGLGYRGRASSGPPGAGQRPWQAGLHECFGLCSRLHSPCGWLVPRRQPGPGQSSAQRAGTVRQRRPPRRRGFRNWRQQAGRRDFQFRGCDSPLFDRLLRHRPACLRRVL